MLLEKETTATLPATTNKGGSQNRETLIAVWGIIDVNSCPHHYNFHLHTTCSDGQLTPEALMEQAIAIGLKGLAITDHHTTKGFERAKQWLEKAATLYPSRPLPQIWTGVEITADLNGTSIHILGYAFNPEDENMKLYLTGETPEGESAKAENVINTIHLAGGLAILAHPFRYRRRGEELILEAYRLGIDGIEAYYAYGNPNPWCPSPTETSLALLLAKEYNLHTTCGTDTHGSNILVRL
ncbi:MAG: PHP domain-containing protein [Geminocystis sp.]|nr:PHP domain-containing protein [Geminocystis sp.]HIK36483.1 PHP domain-containing protein [Geminocystis sp. M7585_C2015_104]MCS7147579.1 PHP domain-containing protein [Geminocystis sp.]MCX8077982.1 PHP domain-containing protein [Geminocystis sp.]MDW8115272.1 PHP domain-containing protein [Geminocystis sp.]